MPVIAIQIIAANENASAKKWLTVTHSDSLSEWDSLSQDFDWQIDSKTLTGQINPLYPESGFRLYQMVIPIEYGFNHRRLWD